MSVIVEAGEVVVVVAVVSVEAGVSCLLAVADFGFLVCESLVEAVLVLVGAAMDEEIKDGGDVGPLLPGLYTFAFATWRDMRRYDYT